MPAIRALALAVAVLLLAACGKKDSGAPPPEAPFTGAPVGCVFDKFAEEEGVITRCYNFSDKTTASYQFVVQYKDKDGKVVKAKPGTAFEAEFDFMSMSGRKYSIKPKSWTEIEIDMLEVPAGAATADVMVTRVGAVAPDGMKIEDLWEYEGGSFEWPVKK
jgi:hypothetical protein